MVSIPYKLLNRASPIEVCLTASRSWSATLSFSMFSRSTPISCKSLNTGPRLWCCLTTSRSCIVVLSASMFRRSVSISCKLLSHGSVHTMPPYRFMIAYRNLVCFDVLAERTNFLRTTQSRVCPYICHLTVSRSCRTCRPISISAINAERAASTVDSRSSVAVNFFWHSA